MDNLTYDQISFVAKYFDGDIRGDIPTNVTLGNHTFKLPVVPANMKCVIDMELAKKLASDGYFYIMHRFYPELDIYHWIGDMKRNNLITSISVGVGEKDKKFLESISDRVGPSKKSQMIDYITIDIAHGHCRLMREMIKYIKESFSNPPFIIAGNVMTHQAVQDLKSWGADCVKVGIGPGAACTSKLKTGFHSPMFSTVKNCCQNFVDGDPEERMRKLRVWEEEYKYRPNFEKRITFEDYIREKVELENGLPIIADGGVRHNGDIFKALVAGARMVMVGSLFSACEDSPAENVYNDDGVLIGKQYFGSASEHNKGYRKNVEGKLVQLKYNEMTFKEKLQEMTEDLQSSISYSGNTSLRDVKDVEYTVSNT